MKKNEIVSSLALFVTGTLWVVLIVILVSKFYTKSSTVYSVDVARVMASYTSVVSAAASNDLDSQVALVQASKSIKAAIRSLVGDSPVHVSASLVSGDFVDITDEVVLSLGLKPVSAEHIKPYSVEFLPNIPKEVAEFDPNKIRALYDDIYNAEAEKIKAQEAEVKLKEKVERIIP
ncbi:hypothetical protein [Pseudoalteromonas marina]|uniref:Uncharacterized protein n=1 Tax=Pseudoalteromonas marina TaxID=267375 RepID=A0ABT9FC38_9GAMM|nr:hypothetical protein [Pseudoalteromonas marina]MDP2564311.1 hypothetical protein [Pseudoalteromonas marina]